MNAQAIKSEAPTVNKGVKYTQAVIDAYNNPEAMIRMHILDYRHQQLVDADSGEFYYRNVVDIKTSIVDEFDNVIYPQTFTDIHVSRKLMDWLTRRKPVYTPDGELIPGEYLTGFENWKKGVLAEFPDIEGFSMDSKLNRIKFQCKNNSPDFYRNPFRLSINQHLKNPAVPGTLYLVYAPSKRIQRWVDPVTGEETRAFVTQTYKDTDKELKLKRENYRRIEFRTIAK